MCDNCKKTETILAKTQYPYEKGWCYIYNFSGKYLNAHYPGIEVDIEQFKETDKHFCSTKCALEFVRKRLKPIKRPVEPINVDECINIVNFASKANVKR